MLAWLSVWSEVQTCIWPSWCHCHSLSLASVKSRLVLPFWYRFIQVVPEKGPLNMCVCVCVCMCNWQVLLTFDLHTTSIIPDFVCLLVTDNYESELENILLVMSSRHSAATSSSPQRTDNNVVTVWSLCQEFFKISSQNFCGIGHISYTFVLRVNLWHFF